MVFNIVPLAQTGESNERATGTFSDSAQVEVFGLTADCSQVMLGNLLKLFSGWLKEVVKLSMKLASAMMDH